MCHYIEVKVLTSPAANSVSTATLLLLLLLKFINMTIIRAWGGVVVKTLRS
jgi:hypothetical protein